MSTISIIIPVSSYLEDMPVLSSLKNIDYPKDKMEVLLSIGKQPSIQRNRAVRIAKGDIVYFFNRDAQVEKDIFKRAVTILNRNENIAGTGGPDLTPADNDYLQKIFGYAMSSYFAHWKMRARYNPIGRERFTDERELLLSNMAIKKDIFLESDGFDETLYPNEENELINRISKKGYKFIYSPDLKIYRSRRNNLLAFIKQFYKYGQGRMNQIFTESCFKNLQFFLPLFFLFYLVILPVIGRYLVSFIPFLAYISLGIADAAYISFKNKKNLIFLLPLIYMIMHLSYGAGMLNALAHRFRSNKGLLEQEIKIKKVELFQG